MPEDQNIPAMPTPPVRKRASRKLLALLLIFFATVLVILFFQSSFSKVSKVEIVGNELTSVDQIGQAARIKNGDNFFLLPTDSVIARIEKLPAIQSAEIHRTFPGAVRISVQEYPRVAFQLGKSGQLLAVLANGAVIAPAQAGMPVDKPLLRNWRDDDPVRKQLCQTLANIPDPYMSDISEIEPEALGGWDDGIRMFTRSHYEVVTRVALLPDKMPLLGDYIHSVQDENHTSGIITMLDTDRYKPFPADTNSGNSSNSDKNVKKN